MRPVFKGTPGRQEPPKTRPWHIVSKYNIITPSHYTCTCQTLQRLQRLNQLPGIDQGPAWLGWCILASPEVAASHDASQICTFHKPTGISSVTSGTKVGPCVLCHGACMDATFKPGLCTLCPVGGTQIQRGVTIRPLVVWHTTRHMCFMAPSWCITSCLCIRANANNGLMWCCINCKVAGPTSNHTHKHLGEVGVMRQISNPTAMVTMLDGCGRHVVVARHKASKTKKRHKKTGHNSNNNTKATTCTLTSRVQEAQKANGIRLSPRHSLLTNG